MAQFGRKKDSQPDTSDDDDSVPIASMHLPLSESLSPEKRKRGRPPGSKGKAKGKRGRPRKQPAEGEGRPEEKLEESDGESADLGEDGMEAAAKKRRAEEDADRLRLDGLDGGAKVSPIQLQKKALQHTRPRSILGRSQVKGAAVAGGGRGLEGGHVGREPAGPGQGGEVSAERAKVQGEEAEAAGGAADGAAGQVREWGRGDGRGEEDVGERDVEPQHNRAEGAAQQAASAGLSFRGPSSGCSGGKRKAGRTQRKTGRERSCGWMLEGTRRRTVRRKVRRWRQGLREKRMRTTGQQRVFETRNRRRLRGDKKKTEAEKRSRQGRCPVPLPQQRGLCARSGC